MALGVLIPPASLLLSVQLNTCMQTDNAWS